MVPGSSGASPDRETASFPDEEAGELPRAHSPTRSDWDLWGIDVVICVSREKLELSEHCNARNVTTRFFEGIKVIPIRVKITSVALPIYTFFMCVCLGVVVQPFIPTYKV